MDFKDLFGGEEGIPTRMATAAIVVEDGDFLLIISDDESSYDESEWLLLQAFKMIENDPEAIQEWFRERQAMN